MESCACPVTSLSSSPTPPPPASFRHGSTGERLRDFFSFVAFALISKLVYVFFTNLSVVAGTILGAISGALIGLKTKRGIFSGVAVGALSGALFSYQLVEASVSFWHSDDDRTTFLHHLIEIFTSLRDGKLLHGWFSPARPDDLERSQDARLANKIDKIQSIRISERNVCDTSGNGISCSVCLQDFQCGEVAGRLPLCGHMFHVRCILEWTAVQNSCPLCRGNIEENGEGERSRDNATPDSIF